MKYSIQFTETAKNDLREIAFYIAEVSKEKGVATNFIDELFNKCQQLIEFPNSGVFPKDRLLKSLEYRYLVHKEYLIFYTVHEELNGIYIEAIFNAKRDYMRVLKKLL